MRMFSPAKLEDSDLVRELKSAIIRERSSTAEVLALIAEVDERRLYVPAGYPSMHAYCVHELHMCENTAYKRIQAARAARQFPALFAAIADGRLHLTAVTLLAPHLTAGNVDEMVAAAAHRTAAEILCLQAELAPKLELSSGVSPILAVQGQRDVPRQLVSKPVAFGDTKHEPVLEPIAPDRFTLNVVINEATHDLLREAKELLGRAAGGDESRILHRALAELVARLRKKKFADTTRPRPNTAIAPVGRHIPAVVQRAVWNRDGGQCTFTSDAGHRCPSRTHIEFDHVLPYALGGQATEANLRLRCRAHNQYTAERELGAEFMKERREEAERLAKERRAARARELLAMQEAEAETVAPYLEKLGFRKDEVRRGTLLAETLPDLPLEEQLRAAIRYLRPKGAPVNAARPAIDDHSAHVAYIALGSNP